MERAGTRLAVEEDGDPEGIPVVLLHGLTATPLARRYAAWFARHPRHAVPPFEAIPAPQQRPHRWAAGLRHTQEIEDASTEAAG